MPSRFLLRNFEQGKTYHLMHRGKPGYPLFSDPSDYKSFVLTLSYYLRYPSGAPLSWVPRLSPKNLAAKQGQAIHKGVLPCVLHAFLLLPDHFHLLITENKSEGKAGISELMRRLSVGYAMTYRNKYGGAGTIYKGKYKMTTVPSSSLSSLVEFFHNHQLVNNTYTKDPLHSSLSDYIGASRSWLKPLPVTGTPTDIAKLTLD